MEENKRTIYVNIGPEIYISAMLKIMKQKGIVLPGEFEEAMAQSLKDYQDGKFTKVEVSENYDKEEDMS